MIFNFSEKTVLVTGSSRGIGRAISEEFLNAGARVIGISTSKINLGKNYSHLELNLINLKDSLKKIDLILEKNKIDILINNVGIYPQASLFESTEKTWDAVFKINLKSLFFISKKLAKQMKNRGGVIINAASYAGSHPSIGSGLYAATKAAVISLTKSMAAEWAPFGIRVNSYSPGFILTDMTQHLYDLHGDDLTKNLAITRPGKAEEVAKAVAYLCSEEASYITGTNIEINGGKFIVQNQSKAKK